MALWLTAGRLTARVSLLLGGGRLGGWVRMQFGCLDQAADLVTGAEGHTAGEAPMSMHDACCRAGSCPAFVRLSVCLSGCACVRARAACVRLSGLVRGAYL